MNRIVENAESAPFKQYFATWRDIGMQHTRLIRAALGYDSDDEEEVDISGFELLKKNGGRAIGFMPDNGQESFRKVSFVRFPFAISKFICFFRLFNLYQCRLLTKSSKMIW